MTTRDALILRAFALALRSLRRRAGFSQERLALEGIDRSHVSGLERGRSDPKLTMLFRLAELLNIPFLNLAREIERNYIRLMEREARKNDKS